MLSSCNHRRSTIPFFCWQASCFVVEELPPRTRCLGSSTPVHRFQQPSRTPFKTVNCLNPPPSTKRLLDRVKFMELLSSHPFAFSPFPSQFYVSVRRNLPFFDYGRFIKKVCLLSDIDRFILFCFRISRTAVQVSDFKLSSYFINSHTR